MPAFVSLLNAFGWSLLDSIWQMAILWTIYFLITAGNKIISAAGRHNLILLFVFFGSEWFVYTFIQLMNVRPSGGTGFIPVPSFVNQFIPYLVTLYLLLLSGRFLRFGIMLYGRRKNKSIKTNSRELEFIVKRHARLMGISRKVSVYLSDLAETAETSRFFKPVILLPVSLLTRLSPQQVEAILVHELLHIRRNDYLVNICMCCYRNIFFFNPFARLFCRSLAIERELACDDAVLEKGYSPEIYAEALFSLEKFRPVVSGFALAANGDKPWLLMERIGRLLGKPAHKKNRFGPLFFFGLASALTLSGLYPENSLTAPAASTQSGQIGVLASRYENVEVSEQVPDLIKKTESNQKLIKKTKIRIAFPIPPAYQNRPSEEPKELQQAYFAENKVIRDFSDQRSAGPAGDPVLASPGTPYIPSMSLFYEAMPDVIAADTMLEIQVLKGIKEEININRIKTIARLNALETEIDSNKHRIREIETKDRKLILADEKSVKPILENIHRLLNEKKMQIEQLRLFLQDSDEEIIHM